MNADDCSESLMSVSHGRTAITGDIEYGKQGSAVQKVNRLQTVHVEKF